MLTTQVAQSLQTVTPDGVLNGFRIPDSASLHIVQGSNQDEAMTLLGGSPNTRSNLWLGPKDAANRLSAKLSEVAAKLAQQAQNNNQSGEVCMIGVWKINRDSAMVATVVSSHAPSAFANDPFVSVSEQGMELFAIEGNNNSPQDIVNLADPAQGGWFGISPSDLKPIIKAVVHPNEMDHYLKLLKPARPTHR